MNGEDITVDLTSAVMVNDSEVTGANNTADNGVVHIIDAVLLPKLLDIEVNNNEIINIFPNPTSELIQTNINQGNYIITDFQGKEVMKGNLYRTINVSDLDNGIYNLIINSNNQLFTNQFIKK